MKLYLDLDSTLTDFVGAVNKLGPDAAKGLGPDAPEEAKQVMYKAIAKAGQAFWSEMEWLPDGKELWEAVKPLNPVILSSPGQFTDAPGGKELWVQKNIPGTPLFLSDDKPEYIDPYETCVLIDDDSRNTSAWESAGGLAIRHTSAAESEKQLMELLWNTPSIDPSKIYWK